MSSEVEAAGAAITAGLVGAAIDGEKAKGVHAELHGACRNCETELSGEFCSNCGQPAHIHRTILHMGEEFLHGLLHFDTRAWRTLPLLVFRPGTLTHSYIHGKRARYISPIALFLLAIFTMFFVFALTGGAVIGGDPPDAVAAAEELEADIEQLNAQLAAARTNVAQAERALVDHGGAPADDPDRIEAAAAVEEARAEEAGLRLALAGAQAGLKLAGGDTAGEDRPEEAEPAGLKGFYGEIAQAADNGDIRVNTGVKSIDKKVLAQLQNPELAVYKIQNTAYKFSFLLVPISLPFMWLLFFWKRGITLFDHSVFILYSLSFMSLLFVVAALIAMGPDALVTFFSSVVSIGLPLHIYFQLKGAYGLGWLSALWRTFVLLIFCLIALGLFLVAIVVLGLAG